MLSSEARSVYSAAQLGWPWGSLGPSTSQPEHGHKLGWGLPFACCTQQQHPGGPAQGWTSPATRRGGVGGTSARQHGQMRLQAVRGEGIDGEGAGTQHDVIQKDLHLWKTYPQACVLRRPYIVMEQGQCLRACANDDTTTLPTFSKARSPPPPTHPSDAARTVFLFKPIDRF